MARLGHVIRLRGGDTASSLFSLWCGVRPGGEPRRRRGRGRGEGPSLSRTPTGGGTLRSRGWSRGPGSRLLAQEAGRPDFKSELLCGFPEVVEHDVHDRHLLHLGRVDLQNRLLIAFPRLGRARGASEPGGASRSTLAHQAPPRMERAGRWEESEWGGASHSRPRPVWRGQGGRRSQNRAEPSPLGPAP